jgi:hypothetical protein
MACIGRVSFHLILPTVYTARVEIPSRERRCGSPPLDCNVSRLSKTVLGDPLAQEIAMINPSDMVNPGDLEDYSINASMPKSEEQRTEQAWRA